jgi:predicted TIM-barrel fold metal-dependent hydrolase
MTFTAKTDFPIVDVDTHLSEPWDLWTKFAKYAPSGYADRLPQVKTVDGSLQWVFDNQPIGNASGCSVVDANMQKQYDWDFLFNTPVHEVAPGASQVAPRLEMMDQQGIWAHIVYPNVVGFGAQQLGGSGDINLRNVTAQIYNDAMAEIQADSGNRLFPQAMIPWWDMEFALQEIDRIRTLGLVGVNTSADPQETGLPDLSDPHWDPMWEKLADAGLPVNFHVGASASQKSYHGTAPWPSLNKGAKNAVGSAMLFLSNGRLIANMIFGGVLERHPTLKVISVESGVSWLPFFLNALDYELHEAAASSQDALSMLPSEYFRRQMGACFWFENDNALIRDSIKQVGEDVCMFETDFPHPTCLYPDPVETVMETFAPETEEFKRKVFGGNAIRIYTLPVPS